MTTLQQMLRDLFSLVLRLTLFMAGLVFIVSLVAATLIGFVGLVAWRLVTGRRPVVPSLADLLREKLSAWPAQAGWAGFPGGAAAGSQAAAARGDVVDVEVREIPDVRPGTR